MDHVKHFSYHKFATLSHLVVWENDLSVIVLFKLKVELQQPDLQMNAWDSLKDMKSCNF